MSAPISPTQPARINAGDTAKWVVSAPDYPASDGWSLTVTLVNAGNRYAVTAAPLGDDFLVTIAASVSDTWAAGIYSTRSQVTQAGEVYTLSDAVITVAPRFGAPVDARSQARRQLEAVESVIEGRASSAVAEYEIAGRRLKHIPITELLVLRDRLRFDVAREDNAQRAAAGLAPRGRISVRFGA